MHNPPHAPSGAAAPLPALYLRKSQTSRCPLGSSSAGEPPQPGRPGRFCLLSSLSLCQKVLLVRRRCGEAEAEAPHGGKSAEGEHPNNALERLPSGGTMLGRQWDRGRDALALSAHWLRTPGPGASLQRDTRRAGAGAASTSPGCPGFPHGALRRLLPSSPLAGTADLPREGGGLIRNTIIRNVPETRY